MRVCACPDCAHGDEPQPDTNFYKTKYRCKVCIRNDGGTRRDLERARRAKIARSLIAVEREGHPCVPIEPWAKWLRTFQRTSGLRIDELVSLFGTSHRRLYGWMRRESNQVYLDVVDKCLCHADMPEVLREIYPELYRFDDFDEEELAA